MSAAGGAFMGDLRCALGGTSSILRDLKNKLVQLQITQFVVDS